MFEDLPTHSVLVISAIALTVGALYLRFWFSQVSRWDLLAFALSCFSAAVYSWFEVAIAKTDSPVKAGELIWWAQIPLGLMVMSVALFVRLYMHSKWKWLFWSVIAVRGAGIILNFFLTPNVSFREISAVNQVSILGESLSIVVGEPSPWFLINYVSLLLFLVYSVESGFTTWQRGDRARALVVGGGVAAYTIVVTFVSVSRVWFPTGLPMLASPAILFIVLAMAFELRYDMRRSSRLATELEVRERQLRESLIELDLSASAADVGVSILNFNGDLIWADKEWYELFEVDQSETITIDKLLDRIDTRDSDRVRSAMSALRSAGGELKLEFRLIMKNGKIRWIRANGKADLISEGRAIVRGAFVDITKLKDAEEKAHDLSRKLIDAQEEERARLARELHDDLSQSLALLSIELDALNHNSSGSNEVNVRIKDLSEQVEKLSIDVHRISHELHPAKLEQLGLEPALRGFCREIARAHDLKIDFRSDHIPRSLSSDVRLCLYRVAQESLQNIVKHSGANEAIVKVKFDGTEVLLTVSDDGCGFDPSASRNRESLGIVSMNERVRAVKGTLTIESAVGAGTKITARVKHPPD